jgi:TolB-like protein
VAVKIQQELIRQNINVSDESKVQLRIGLNLGEVIIDRGEIYGSGVNLAARLESIAYSTGICISSGLYDQIKGKTDILFTDGGLVELKNIAEPTHVYHWQEPLESNTSPGPVSELTTGGKQPTIAVLPFDNMSGDDEQEYFSDGITEDIITDLSKVSSLFIVARNSSFTYKGRAVKTQEICADLGVRYVVEGSVRKAGNKVRINAQLIDGSTGGHVWADRYDGTMDDIFELQDQITCQIVEALKVNLLPDEKQSIQQVPTDNVEAYNFLLLGRHAESSLTEQGYDSAIRYFEQAIALDPTFARAHYCLYLATYDKCMSFGDDRALLQKSKIAVDNAKKFGFKPAAPWIHIRRRLYKDELPTTRELALEAMDKIRHYDPEWGSFGYEQMTWILPATGYFTATLEFAKHMFDSPTHNYEDSDANEELPNYYAAVGQFDEAIGLWSSEIQKDPLNPKFRLERACLYARTGQFKSADLDIDVLDEERFLFLAKATYYYWRQQPRQLKKYHDRLFAIVNLHPAYRLYSNVMTGDMPAAIEDLTKATDSSSSASFVDFGYIRSSIRAQFPMTLVDELERQPGFQIILEREGITDEWCAELMERVNELADITGIRIKPDDD